MRYKIAANTKAKAAEFESTNLRYLRIARLL
jgi:hypothetical protein